MAKGRKTGGRLPGSQNKTTKKMKAVIQELLDDYSESGLMDSDFKALKPVERITMAEKFMQYTTPKMQSIQAEVRKEEDKTIEDKLVELSKIK